MATTNDVTGDALVSRLNSEEFEKNFDKIFGEKPKKPRWVPPPPIHICTYSRTMNQEYPRKCVHCGKVEALEQPITRDWKETIDERIARDSKFKEALEQKENKNGNS